MLHFERRHEPLAPRIVFLLRVLRNFVIASLLIAALIGFGTWGFSYFEKQPFVESLHNAVRIVCGLEPTRPAVDNLGRWFEIVFYLLSNLAVVVSTGIFLVPILHRVMHRFHVE